MGDKSLYLPIILSWWHPLIDLSSIAALKNNNTLLTPVNLVNP